MSVPAAKIRRLRDPAAIELPPIDQDPRFVKAMGDLREVEAREAAAAKRRKVALARLRGEEPTRSYSERAAALLKGGQVSASPPGPELAAANEELEILGRALVEKRAEVTRVREEISHEVAKRFEDANAQGLRATLQALTDLHQALEVGRVIRGRLIGAGYMVNEHVLPATAINFSGPGDPERRSLTPAGMFRDWLERRGLL